MTKSSDTKFGSLAVLSVSKKEQDRYQVCILKIVELQHGFQTLCQAGCPYCHLSAIFLGTIVSPVLLVDPEGCKSDVDYMNQIQIWRSLLSLFTRAW